MHNSLDNDYTHEAYSDESNYNFQDYMSVCMISFEKSLTLKLNEQINNILKESNVQEFTWKKLNSAKNRFCAIKLLKLIINYCKNEMVRIDVLICPIKNRKKLFRDNEVNLLKKMYYQLFINVLMKRWAIDTKWVLFPDEQGAIDWYEMRQILNHTIKNIKSITPSCSTITPICQIADLFGGMAVFSYQNPQKLFLDIEQKTLFNIESGLSNSDIERVEVCKLFKSLCNRNGLNIILDKGYKTIDPNEKINFWFFEVKDYRDEKLRL